MSFLDQFKKVTSGASPAQIEHLLGRPDQAEDTRIPDNSAWGTQDSLTYKIPAGSPVKQWVFRRENKDCCVWFAEVDGEWKVTLRLCVPQGLVSGSPTTA
jgi:hypothetical protein